MTSIFFLMGPVAIVLLALFIRKYYLDIIHRQNQIIKILFLMRQDVSQKIEYIDEAQQLLAHYIDEQPVRNGWTDEKRRQMSELKKAQWAQKKAAKFDGLND